MRERSPVPLNVREGPCSQKGNERARFLNPLESAAEVRACLAVAEALGYVDPIDPALRDPIEHAMAKLHRLVRR